MNTYQMWMARCPLDTWKSVPTPNKQDAASDLRDHFSEVHVDAAVLESTYTG